MGIGRRMTFVIAHARDLRLIDTRIKVEPMYTCNVN